MPCASLDFVESVLARFIQEDGVEGLKATVFHFINQIEGWPNMLHSSPIFHGNNYSASSALPGIDPTLSATRPNHKAPAA